MDPANLFRCGRVHLLEKRSPAGVLEPDVVTVIFTTDKALAPTATDKRELALIVKTIGLVPRTPDVGAQPILNGVIICFTDLLMLNSS